MKSQANIDIYLKKLKKQNLLQIQNSDSFSEDPNSTEYGASRAKLKLNFAHMHNSTSN